MTSTHTRSQQTYDHRLRDLVRTLGDPEIVAELGKGKPYEGIDNLCPESKETVATFMSWRVGD